MPNEYKNKVIYGDTTLMDITDTTAETDDVLEGEVFYAKNGARSIGTLGDATQSTHGLMSASDKTKLDGLTSMVVLSYGNSTWQDFLNAYNSNSVVYCRASSNSNPASGSQTRMAFMAYVNDATNPANVEFQYYRSMSAHSSTAMGDEVYVYKLTNANGGTWSVTTRKASIKEIAVASGSKLGVSWSSDKVTLSNTMTADDMPMSSSDATTAKSEIDTLKTNIADLATVATSGSYNDLLNKPIIPTNVSSFTNDAGYLTSHQDISGKADLDSNGKVLTTELPSYVDDVLEFDALDISNWSEWMSGTSYEIGNRVKVTDNEEVTGYICTTANDSTTFDETEWQEATVFPAEGESGKIYVATGTNITYRWSGSNYVAIGSDLALGETSSTAYRGDRGAAAYAAAVTNVTSTATSGSSNLITSGGVYNVASNKADKRDTVLDTTLSIGRKANTTIGYNSIALGYNVTASGSYSQALGQNTTASSYEAHAEGDGTTASNSAAHAEGRNSTASGYYSHAEGYAVTASGHYSHAEGHETLASGETTHAEGLGGTFSISGTSYTSSAYGVGAHTEGFQTQVDGTGSHAEGYNTRASGTAIHVEGYQTYANRSYTHAEGYQTYANADGSHVEGYKTQATGAYSHAEGCGGTFTINSTRYTSGTAGSYAHSEGQLTYASGTSSHAEGYETRAIGYRSHAEGNLTYAYSDDTHAEGYGGSFTTSNVSYTSQARGTGSHSEGYQTIADSTNGGTISGVAAHSEGIYTCALNSGAHAEGSGTIASGLYSHAEGGGAKATAQYSHAEGAGTTASGQFSHAEGAGTTASGDYSHVEGSGNTAAGSHSHAEGMSTTASGSQSHSEGVNSSASGVQSHAEGNSTVASGSSSHAEGCKTSTTVTINNTTFTVAAAGHASHTEGQNTCATSTGMPGNHAEGLETAAAGGASHAEGNQTLASGMTAHAEGYGTIANARAMHAQGQFNVTASLWPEWAADTSYEVGDKVIYINTSYICTTANSSSTFDSSQWSMCFHNSDTAFVIGNGNSTARSNALSVDWDGNEYLKGDLYANCNSDSTGGSKVITEASLFAMFGLSVDANGYICQTVETT